MPKASRLRQARQFVAVFACNCSVGGENFVVSGMPNNLGFPRLGLVASRKVAPRAVDRNGFRRQVREVFRLNQHQLGAMDVVVKLRRPFQAAAPAGARAELLRLMLKLEKCRAC